MRSRPKYLLRDRDGVYGTDFSKRVAALGLKEKLIAPHSPWHNPHAERLIGTLRRECLNQIVIFGERQLRAVLEEYFEYYHHARTHCSLAQDSPVPRLDLPPARGTVVEFLQVGRLHHLYTRRAA